VAGLEVPIGQQATFRPVVSVHFWALVLSFNQSSQLTNAKICCSIGADLLGIVSGSAVQPASEFFAGLCRKTALIDFEGLLMSRESDAFEQRIHRIHELIDGTDAEVTWNARIPDPDNPKRSRQIDITIKRETSLTLVECRIHSEPQDVKWVEELIGRRASLKASSVIGVSASGFTEGAVLKAKAHGIVLRDLEELTPAEVEQWGTLVALTMYYYEFRDLSLDLLFRPESIPRLDMSVLELEVKTYHGRQSLFNAASDEIEKLKLLTLKPEQRKAVRFAIRLRLEDFCLCGEPVVEVEFSGIARLVEKPLEVPSVVSYRDLSGHAEKDSTVIQNTLLGETGVIVHETDRMATIVDLSAITLPPNSQFRYFRTAADREMDMDSFELIGTGGLYASGGPMTVTISSWSE
jgi:hypothetical protein